MEKSKEQKIRNIVENKVKSFANKFEKRYTRELTNPTGVINSKKNNFFINDFGDEFIFYSAFCRSFDSSFGKVLEELANEIAELSFEVSKEKISSYLLPQQTQHIDYLMSEYKKHAKPSVKDYETFMSYIPQDLTSYKNSHVTDNHFFNSERKEHYVIELKSGGNLDNKKSKSEKEALLQQYFILKNSLIGKNENVKIFLATAYNMFGQDSDWNQERVKQYFDEDELLIGKDYWNFVCDEDDGFDIIYDQYKISSQHIINVINKIKKLYFG